MKFKVDDTISQRRIMSENFNHYFRKSDGLSMTWGKTQEDDPEFAPFPLLMDMEIVSMCRGIRGKDGIRKPCPFCYKSNTPEGDYMTFETFKEIISKICPIMRVEVNYVDGRSRSYKPSETILTLDGEKSVLNLTKNDGTIHGKIEDIWNVRIGPEQIAFGVDAEATLNPDMFKMMLYCKEIGIVPNVTVADIGPEIAQLLSSMCGAISVSVYSWNKDAAYDSIDLLANKYKMNQVNIHMLVASETEDFIFNELLEDVKTDPRLKNLNAIVFLSLKTKGRGKSFHRMSDVSYKKLVDKLLGEEINFGFDSCSQIRFKKAIQGHPNYDAMIEMSQNCESTCESIYINEDGKFFPCSFTEKGKFGGEDWEKGIDILQVDDFFKDIWFNPKVISTRNKIIECGKCDTSCFAFDI